MPEIVKDYHLDLPYNNVYPEVLESLNHIGIQALKQTTESDQSQTIEGFAPSIWGWGGMSIKVNLKQTQEGTALRVGGYIAQLATSPLAKMLDQLLNVLSQQLLSKYQYNFTVEKLNTFLPRFSYHMNKKDIVMIITILGGGLVISILGMLLGKGIESLVWIPVIAAAYYWGRKYFYNK